ncbi:unnamed protein product, partial [Mesorhabditis belari]|uniref:Uncharacterized protein n=1 Tax=Mesorhabditis belari TaxID=2138241 RepID=A0AAF3J403_9BILA
MYRFLSSRFPSTSCAKLSQRVKRFSSTLKNEENLANETYFDAPVGLRMLAGHEPIKRQQIEKANDSNNFGVLSSTTPQKRTVRLLDAGIFVPTTETELLDSRSGDESSLEEVLEGFFQNGCNVSEAIEGFSDYCTADSALNISDQGHSYKPSTSPTVSPKERRTPGTRRILTKKMQRTLLKRRNMSSIIAPSTEQPGVSNVEASMISTPEIVSALSIEPPVRRTVEVFQIDPNRQEKASISEIEEALNTNTIQAMRDLFTCKKWPDIRGTLPNRVLQLVVNEAKNYDEALEFFKDYATISRNVFVSDHLAMKLAIKAALENEEKNPATVAILALQTHRKTFLARPKFVETKAEFCELIGYVGAKCSINDSIGLYECIQSKGFYVDADRFIQAICKAKISSGVSFSVLQKDWEQLCLHFSACHGFGLLVKKVFEEQISEDKACGKLLAFTNEVGYPPSAALAEIVSALVSFKREPEAERILQRIFVKPTYFKRPLSNFLESPNGIEDFENTIQLLGRHLFKETKKGGKRKGQAAASIEDQATTDEKVNEDLVRTILEFFGIREKRRRQKEIKSLKIDSERLAELSTHIQRTWIRFAQKNEDLTIITRLRQWGRDNRMELSPESEKQVRQLKGDLERKSTTVQKIIVSIRQSFMLGFVRNSAKRHAYLRRLSNIAAATPSTSAAPLELSSLPLARVTEEVKDDERALLKRYGKELERSEWKTFGEATSFIEWNNYLMSYHLQKLNQIITQGSLKSAELSDRQISLLIKAYGGLASGTPKKTRIEELKKLLQKIASEEVEMGPQSLTSLLSAKLDNNEPIKVVEELEKWDLKGYEPTNELLIILSKVYAGEGNVKGVSELMQYAKEEKMEIMNYLLTSLVKAFAVQGKYAEAETTIQEALTIDEKLPPLLRLSICEVAAKKKDIEILWQQMALISIDKMASLTKIQRKIVVALIENKLWSEVEKVRQHFALIPTGSERFPNSLQHPQFLQKMWAFTWSLIKEDRLDCALVAYSFTRKTDEKQQAALSQAITRKASQIKVPLNEALALAEMAVAHEIEPSIGSLLLKAVEYMPAQRLVDVLKILPSTDIEMIAPVPEIRLSLAKKLSGVQDLASVEQKVSYLEQIAKLLFESLPPMDRDYIEAAHRSVCVCFRGDLEIAKLVVDQLSSDFATRNKFSTAVVDSYLRIMQLDSSATQKLLDFLKCGKIAQLELYPIQYSLSKMLRQIKADTSSEQLNIIALAIILSFPADPKIQSGRIAGLFTGIVKHKQVDAEVVEKLVDKILLLDTKKRVGIYDADMAKLVSELEEAGNFGKAASLQKLSRKGQTMARWQGSTVEQLDTELSILMEKKVDVKVVNQLRSVILDKIATETPINLAAGTRHCIAAIETKTINQRLFKAILNFKKVGFGYALENGLIDEALGLFDPTMEIGISSALHLAALLHASDRISDADNVIAKIKEAKLDVTPNNLEKLSNALGSLSVTQIEAFAAYLQTALNLKSTLLKRLLTKRVLNSIKKLIDEENLAEAFVLSVNESKKFEYAIGRIELAKAAVAKGNQELLGDVFRLITKYHSTESAHLDLGYALLWGGHVTLAEKMFAKGGKVSTQKLSYLVLDSYLNKRSDVLRSLFDILVKDENVSRVDLNNLLANLCKLYYTEKNAEAADSLREQCRQLSFPLEKATQEKFKLLQQLIPKKRESTV